jgi:hypothetical protein
MMEDKRVADTPTGIDELCNRLFDSFCERKSVMPLAYLMQAWPLIESNSRQLDTLLHCLDDLGRWHTAELLATERTLIRQIVAMLAANVGETVDSCGSGGRAQVAHDNGGRGRRGYL